MVCDDTFLYAMMYAIVTKWLPCMYLYHYVVVYPFGWVGKVHIINYQLLFYKSKRDVSPGKVWSRHEKIMNTNKYTIIFRNI